MKHSGNTNNKKHYYATSWISHLVC